MVVRINNLKKRSGKNTNEIHQWSVLVEQISLLQQMYLHTESLHSEKPLDAIEEIIGFLYNIWESSLNNISKPREV